MTLNQEAREEFTKVTSLFVWDKIEYNNACKLIDKYITLARTEALKEAAEVARKWDREQLASAIEELIK